MGKVAESIARQVPPQPEKSVNGFLCWDGEFVREEDMDREDLIAALRDTARCLRELEMKVYREGLDL